MPQRLDGELQAPVTAFANDVHKRAGFSCADCHGGDRNADDSEVSMSKARGFEGKISAHRGAEAVRPLPQRRQPHAQVQAAAARGSVGAVPDQRARQAPGRRRHGGGQLRRLPQRA